MRIVLINCFSMKRIVLLLFGIGISLFLTIGQVFAVDIQNNIEDNLINNIEDNIEDNLINNIDDNSEKYIENNSVINIEDNSENNTSQEMAVITKDENNKNEKSSPSLKDIFGDDQTFPFVAGFGKD